MESAVERGREREAVDRHAKERTIQTTRVLDDTVYPFARTVEHTL